MRGWLGAGSGCTWCDSIRRGHGGQLQPFIDNHSIAGAVVLVANKDKVLDLEAVGYSNVPDKKPMQTSDLFYIASQTKCFTAVALMMMMDEGKVNIDDPVEKYLPEFKGQKVEQEEKPRTRPRIRSRSKR